MDINSIYLAFQNISITPEWVTALATIILVLTTIVYVFFAGKLTQETVKLREVETTSFISIYFDTTFSAVSHSKIVIKNIGKAPAYNISFNIDDKYLEHFNGYTFENDIEYFAPEQEFYILANGFNALKEAGFDSIPITVEYKAKDNRSFRELYNLRWQHYQYYEKDNIEGIRKALEDIKKEVTILNKTIKDKDYQVTTKLKILELEKTDMYLKFIFSNGYLGKIHNDEVSKFGIIDVKQTFADNGDLVDHSSRIKFTAEEIYYKLQNSNYKGK